MQTVSDEVGKNKYGTKIGGARKKTGHLAYQSILSVFLGNRGKNWITQPVAYQKHSWKFTGNKSES